MKMTTEQQNLYASPLVKIIEIKAQAIICQSGSTINDLNPREDDSGNWGNL